MLGLGAGLRCFGNSYIKGSVVYRAYQISVRLVRCAPYLGYNIFYNSRIPRSEAYSFDLQHQFLKSHILNLSKDRLLLLSLQVQVLIAKNM